jgi:hypothetical protein
MRACVVCVDFLGFFVFSALQATLRSLLGYEEDILQRVFFGGACVCVRVDEQWAFEFLSSWRILGSSFGAFCVHSFGVSGFPCLRNGLSGL